MKEPVIIKKALKDDLPEILALQKVAFTEVAKQYNVADLPPLKQTLDDIHKEFMDGIILKALIDGTTVGSVRANIEDGTCHINKLVVLPDYQNRGIGKQLMKAIEHEFSGLARQYELFTGSRDPKNRYLYEKLDYVIFKEEKLNDQITFIYMRKKATS